jgi:hypothetical protein
MRFVLPLLLVLALLAGCRTTERAVDPDTEFGHRFEAHDPEGRRVLSLVPPAPGEEFFTYPTPVTGLRVRTGPMLDDGRRGVELIVEGALPDACTELHHVSEARTGQFLNVTFQIRRPKGALCAQVIRPFRFYYELSTPLAPGPYTLRLNDRVHPFEVFPEPITRS